LSDANVVDPASDVSTAAMLILVMAKFESIKMQTVHTKFHSIHNFMSVIVSEIEME
jgi:hypothetical protein